MLAVPLWLVSRSLIASLLVSATGALVAAGWVLERSAGTAGPLSIVEDALPSSPELVAVGLLVVGVLGIFLQRRHGSEHRKQVVPVRRSAEPDLATH